MEILATSDTWWMTQCDAVLLAEQIPSRWNAISGSSAAVLDVPVSEAERAVCSLSELLGEELKKRQTIVEPVPQGPLLLQPAFAVAVCLAALTLVFFSMTRVEGTGLRWEERGILITERLLMGDWWRLITAATLHADISHAVSNAGFFLVLAWAAGERFGSGVTLALWLTTAVVGFVASVVLSHTEITLGASGGLFGLLGAAAGHAVRHRDTRGLVRRDRIRAFAGGVLLLAFTAFSPRANIHAHVGGFVSGLLCGLVMPARPPRAWLQVLSGLAAAALVFLAWRIARA
jgi:rhomboid protease GluP